MSETGETPRYLFLEPFYGGSHRAFADGWVARSRHAIDLVTLPDRFWKWRMRGAALHFARKITSPSRYRGLIATDLMSLSDLKALWGAATPRALLYFHENQLSYPVPEGESIDYQFGFTDITSALAADRVLFNSSFHHDSFFSNLPGFIGMMPEYNPKWVIEEIRARSGTLHPGCDFAGGPSDVDRRDTDGPPLVIWNHRWEFDKRPEDFFAALDAVLGRGREFRLALLGENFQFVPKDFIAARERYGPRVVRYGYVEDRVEYMDWLRRGSVVISTAQQENFGLSIVEAVRMGCFPLLPDRLSYPELLEKRFHSTCLYRSTEELVDRLDRLLAGPEATESQRRDLAESMGRFSWDARIEAFDAALDRLAG